MHIDMCRSAVCRPNLLWTQWSTINKIFIYAHTLSTHHDHCDHRVPLHLSLSQPGSCTQGALWGVFFLGLKPSRQDRPNHKAPPLENLHTHQHTRARNRWTKKNVISTSCQNTHDSKFKKTKKHSTRFTTVDILLPGSQIPDSHPRLSPQTSKNTFHRWHQVWLSVWGADGQEGRRRDCTRPFFARSLMWAVSGSR